MGWLGFLRGQEEWFYPCCLQALQDICASLESSGWGAPQSTSLEVGVWGGQAPVERGPGAPSPTWRQQLAAPQPPGPLWPVPALSREQGLTHFPGNWGEWVWSCKAREFEVTSFRFVTALFSCQL